MRTFAEQRKIQLCLVSLPTDSRCANPCVSDSVHIDKKEKIQRPNHLAEGETKMSQLPSIPGLLTRHAEERGTKVAFSAPGREIVRF